MKVLVISVTCGQGHNSTAKALIKTLEKKGAECYLLDAFEHINKIIAKAIDDGYQLSTKYMSKPYSSIYKHVERRTPTHDEFSSVKIVNTLLASKLRKTIENYNPEVIVTTHCFAAAMVEILTQKGIIDSVNIGIVTDFTVHPFWEESPGFNKIVIANELLEFQAVKKGFKPDQLLCTGIPVDLKFKLDNFSKPDVRKKLGLDPDKKTVLIMSGSMGFGNIKEIVSKIDNIQADFQAIVVCGNNKQAQAQINKMRKSKKFLVYGYVNNVEELMAASDCIITKPGGLTSSEALAMQLPMILVNPIPGQEERNLEFLLNNGAAMAASDTCPVEEVIFQIFKNPERIVQMKKAVEYLSKPDSTEKLAEYIMNQQQKA